ncbi:hypothetical protein UFOVP1616_23 [uncultured Caudovirales phage]|uniref:Uncharacterized protein n=1 Tax=uncultured Caudovirales phage TaxID=2100421 RepID=A0A6J5SLZ2_9CAUD|nr:hypothetical protein UFOVP1467_39 [uncultured Caudovirales phage]CAB4219642.1 hypothetical protein UFOVP1616_23 [uncultured Caudovirales phage]
MAAGINSFMDGVVYGMAALLIVTFLLGVLYLIALFIKAGR